MLSDCECVAFVSLSRNIAIVLCFDSIKYNHAWLGCRGKNRKQREKGQWTMQYCRIIIYTRYLTKKKNHLLIVQIRRKIIVYCLCNSVVKRGEKGQKSIGWRKGWKLNQCSRCVSDATRISLARATITIRPCDAMRCDAQRIGRKVQCHAPISRCHGHTARTLHLSIQSTLSRLLARSVRLEECQWRMSGLGYQKSLGIV